MSKKEFFQWMLSRFSFQCSDLRRPPPQGSCLVLEDQGHRFIQVPKVEQGGPRTSKSNSCFCNLRQSEATSSGSARSSFLSLKMSRVKTCQPILIRALDMGALMPEKASRQRRVCPFKALGSSCPVSWEPSTNEADCLTVQLLACDRLDFPS